MGAGPHQGAQTIAHPAGEWAPGARQGVDLVTNGDACSISDATLVGEMRASLAWVRWLPLVALVAAHGCKDEDPPTQDGDSTGDESPQATFQPGTDTATTEQPPATGTEESGVVDDTGNEGGGECDMFEQDCMEGEKCVPWSELADLMPDAIRCCPIAEPMAFAGDICTLEGHLGSCIDNCAPGTMCFDFDGDGEGVCQEMCGGTAENPTCSNEPDDVCFIFWAGVPFCFSKCDPLVQDCPADKGCYPDAIAEGGTGFLCMPTLGDQTLGEYCWLLSGCNPGMICATADLLPNCFGPAGDTGCCTDLCDITEVPDPCTDIHPDLECVPWYHQGAEPPSADLQDVGACVLPTVGGGA